MFLYAIVVVVIVIVLIGITLHIFTFISEGFKHDDRRHRLPAPPNG